MCSSINVCFKGLYLGKKWGKSIREKAWQIYYYFPILIFKFYICQCILTIVLCVCTYICMHMCIYMYIYMQIFEVKLLYENKFYLCSFEILTWQWNYIHITSLRFHSYCHFNNSQRMHHFLVCIWSLAYSKMVNM